MPREYFDRFSDMARKFQGPMQELMRLNIETLQNVTYLKPDELLNIKNPENLLSKQVDIMFGNLHKSLDYWQNVLTIGERTAHSYFEEARNVVNQSRNDINKNVKESFNNQTQSKKTKQK